MKIFLGMLGIRFIYSETLILDFPGPLKQAMDMGKGCGGLFKI
jgi:hypothetical protein